MKKEVKTNNSDKIILENGGYGTPETYVYLNTIHYATIQGVHLNEIDEEKLKEWISDTSNDEDYKQPSFLIHQLSGHDFYIGLPKLCQDFADTLNARNFFDKSLELMLESKSFNEETLWMEMKKEAKNQNIYLSDANDWDYEFYFDGIFSKFESLNS